MSKKVVTFGEIMMRINPKLNYRLVQADEFNVTYAGAEASVAVSLAQFGLDAYFVTKVPNTEIGQCAINAVRKYGVNTSYILRSTDRLGIYFVEKGASQRPSKVIYDRKNSAIANAKLEDFDWDLIFNDAIWFHFTGITPALSDSLVEICLEACKKAKEKGLTISCDLNYRNKLWEKSKARAVMSKLMPFVDVCIANEEDAKDVFGIESKNSNVQSGELNVEGYKEVAKKLTKMFDLKYVAFTLRESISANDNIWSGLLYKDGEVAISPKYNIHIVDRFGGGDSFGAGLIYSLINKETMQNAVDFAVGASCLKHSIEGDFNLVSFDEVMTLVKGNASGRVQR
ncbi:MAG: sugar kinase [Bacilli bacterium]|jgi:2-dehydro-3-deoxygluconokinase|nr:sugar kinase [Bacilli bacterium]